MFDGREFDCLGAQKETALSKCVSAGVGNGKDASVACLQRYGGDEYTMADATAGHACPRRVHLGYSMAIPLYALFDTPLLNSRFVL